MSKMSPEAEPQNSSPSVLQRPLQIMSPPSQGRKEKQTGAIWHLWLLPAAQILGHGCPAAEQIGSQGLEPLPQPHHSGQRLGVQVQHGVLLLDVDQGLFVHVLQKLFGLLRHLRKQRPPSALLTHRALHTTSNYEPQLKYPRHVKSPNWVWSLSSFSLPETPH